MNESILVEVSLPAASLHYLAEISIWLTVQEVIDGMLYTLQEVKGLYVNDEGDHWLCDARTGMILHPSLYLYECDICYGDRLLFI